MAHKGKSGKSSVCWTSLFPRPTCYWNFPSEAENLSSVEQGQILEAIAHCLLKYQTDDDRGEDFQILETNLCQRGGFHKFLPFSVMCPKQKSWQNHILVQYPFGNGPWNTVIWRVRWECYLKVQAQPHKWYMKVHVEVIVRSSQV